MKNGMWGTVAVAAALAACQAGAGAQVTGNLSGQVGINALMTTAGRSATNAGGLHLGLSYKLNRAGLFGGAATPSVEFDYNSNSGNGGRIDAYGLFITERIAMPQTRGAGAPYFGLGIGVQNTDVKDTYTITVPQGVHTEGRATTSISRSGSNVQIVGKGLVGWNLSSKYFTELQYNFGGTAIGSRADALAFSLGMHF